MQICQILSKYSLVILCTYLLKRIPSNYQFTNHNIFPRVNPWSITGYCEIQSFSVWRTSFKSVNGSLQRFLVISRYVCTGLKMFCETEHFFYISSVTFVHPSCAYSGWYLGLNIYGSNGKTKTNEQKYKLTRNRQNSLPATYHISIHCEWNWEQIPYHGSCLLFLFNLIEFFDHWVIDWVLLKISFH